MIKPNYRHAKKQRELAKKTKQQAKQQRRSEALDTQNSQPQDGAAQAIERKGTSE